MGYALRVCLREKVHPGAYLRRHGKELRLEPLPGPQEPMRSKLNRVLLVFVTLLHGSRGTVRTELAILLIIEVSGAGRGSSDEN